MKDIGGMISHNISNSPSTHRYLILSNYDLSVPIIPEYLIAADIAQREQELFSENETQWLSDIDVSEYGVNVTLHEAPDNLTESYKESLIERALQLPIRAISENSKVGWLLSSKALLQLLVNPVIGVLSYRSVNS